MTKLSSFPKILNMEITETLERIGLNEKEARIYLALLELGSASVQAISLKAEVKRPTTYLVLDNLKRRGLVSLIPRAKKKLYTIESPENLMTDLVRKEELLKRYLPNLLALHTIKKERPQVQLFQGADGVRQIYQQIFQAGRVWLFGTTQKVAKLYPEGLQDFITKSQDKSFQVRDLLISSAQDLSYAKEVKKKVAGKNYEIRFLNKNLEFPSDSAIYGDRVAFFAFTPEVFVVVIKSREISQSLRSLYELAWQVSEPAY